MNLDKIRQKLRQRIHHTRQQDKHVFTYSRMDLNKTFLEWEYDDNTVYVSAKDENIAYVIKECIEMYIEETEGEEL